MRSPIAAAMLAAAFLLPGRGAGAPPVAPEFTQRNQAGWLNSEPLTLAGLRGQVVLIEFWTYGCINCRRTLPWLKAMHARYADDGLVVVGVHTPEFDHERDASNVREAVQRLGIEYPVMLDPGYAYWRALANRYWPAFYLVGRDGRIQATAIGELHERTTQGDAFEEQIRRSIDNPVASRGATTTRR
jgi:thiol-disulfide isomerase/thioredoxin